MNLDQTILSACDTGGETDNCKLFSLRRADREASTGDRRAARGETSWE